MKEKDKELFLVSVLKIFVVLFLSSFIVRLIGFDAFGFDVDNSVIHKITNVIYIGYIGQFIILYFSCFVMMKLICNNGNDKRYYVVSFLITLLNILIQLLLNDTKLNQFYTILNIFMLLIGIFAVDGKIPIKKTIIVFGMNMLYQGIAMVIRNVSYHGEYTEIYDFLLQFDYIILLAISYIIVKMKGSEFRWSLKVVGSSLHLPHLSKKSVIKSPKQSLSKEERREKLSENIYLFLVIIWNFFTLGCVIVVCTLNTTFITTLFLLVSFMVTKSTFGKAFHMKSALSCFVVSNLVYFALSRITVSIHVSFVVPIVLGVGLSYVTSLLVKKRDINLYRGMPTEELREICQNAYLNEYETCLLEDFYCYRMSLVRLAGKYHYSKDTIYYHKKKAIAKIKEL